ACLLLAVLLLGLAACGESTSTTRYCPPRPLAGRAEDWAQAPGEVALALPYTVFGTNERVQGAVFNHTQVIIETTPVRGHRCAVFNAERLVSGVWQAFDSCLPMGEAPVGGNAGNVVPGDYILDQLKIVLSPGTYRLKLTYAIYPHNPVTIDGTVYSLPFQVCECARCA
ncbi:MAG: hypothetical protein ACXWP6_10475, partial [Ktedonobacterales bacterium]